MRKPTTKAGTLEALSPDQKREVINWMLTPGLTYRLIRQQVSEEFGCDCSEAQLSRFWQEYGAPVLLRRRRELIGLADQIQADAEAAPGKFDAATIDALKQKALELSVAPTTSTEELKVIFSLVLKAQAQETDREKLEHEREKFKAAIRTKLEAGLDALFEEIKGNTAAEAIFAQLREVVATS